MFRNLLKHVNRLIGFITHNAFPRSDIVEFGENRLHHIDCWATNLMPLFLVFCCLSIVAKILCTFKIIYCFRFVCFVEFWRLIYFRVAFFFLWLFYFGWFWLITYVLSCLCVLVLVRLVVHMYAGICMCVCMMDARVCVFTHSSWMSVCSIHTLAGVFVCQFVVYLWWYNISTKLVLVKIFFLW